MTPHSRLLAVAAVAAVVLTGCGNGPIRAGAAATVGDDRITTTALDDLVTRGLLDPSAQQNVGTDWRGFERTVLRRLIEHEILVQAAAGQHVSITRGDVLAARDRIAQQIGGESALDTEALKAGISLKDLDQTIGDVALRDAIADKLTASIPVPNEALAQAYQQNIAQYDQVRSAHILVSSAAQAQSLLAQVKAHPGEFAALAAKYSTDPGSKAQGGDLGFQGRGALAKPFEDAIFSAKPGSFVIAHTQFGFHVIHVIARRITSLKDASNDLRRGLLAQQRSDATQALLQQVAKRLGVYVNPRFGTWDPASLDVIEVPIGPDSATKPSPRPGDATATPGLTGP